MLFAAFATLVLVAPSFHHHRVRFRDGTKGEMITMANTLAPELGTSEDQVRSAVSETERGQRWP